MNKKKTLTIGLGIIAVCLLIAVAGLFVNRSEKRQPTEAEQKAYDAYSIDWQKEVGMEGSDMEIILSFCEPQGEKTIGANVYQIYTSSVLPQYLPDFGEMMEIAQLKGILYIQYTTPEGNMITLGYDQDGQCEKSIYDQSEDTMYYETREVCEVWTKFRSGVQWGN